MLGQGATRTQEAIGTIAPGQKMGHPVLRRPHVTFFELVVWGRVEFPSEHATVSRPLIRIIGSHALDEASFVK
jgi:hypothetical protein